MLHTTLKKLRKAKSWSQQTAATEAGMSIRHYAQLESGPSNPRVDTLKALAKAYSVSLQTLLK